MAYPGTVAWKCQSMRACILQHVLPSSPTWLCMGRLGAVCPGLRSLLLSSQNSLKASNRKKKRTSFKRKASKRGTDVSVSGSPPYHRFLGLPGCGPRLLFGRTSYPSFLLPSTLTTLGFRAFLNTQLPPLHRAFALSVEVLSQRQ